jgi:hypothetical protein
MRVIKRLGYQILLISVTLVFSAAPPIFAQIPFEDKTDLEIVSTRSGNGFMIPSSSLDLPRSTSTRFPILWDLARFNETWSP